MCAATCDAVPSVKLTLIATISDRITYPVLFSPLPRACEAARLLDGKQCKRTSKARGYISGTSGGKYRQSTSPDRPQGTSSSRRTRVQPVCGVWHRKHCCSAALLLRCNSHRPTSAVKCAPATVAAAAAASAAPAIVDRSSQCFSLNACCSMHTACAGKRQAYAASSGDV